MATGHWYAAAKGQTPAEMLAAFVCQAAYVVMMAAIAVFNLVAGISRL
jgi:hypothetical protein